MEHQRCWKRIRAQSAGGGVGGRISGQRQRRVGKGKKRTKKRRENT